MVQKKRNNTTRIQKSDKKLSGWATDKVDAALKDVTQNMVGKSVNKEWTIKKQSIVKTLYALAAGNPYHLDAVKDRLVEWWLAPGKDQRRGG